MNASAGRSLCLALIAGAPLGGCGGDAGAQTGPATQPQYGPQPQYVAPGYAPAPMPWPPQGGASYSNDVRPAAPPQAPAVSALEQSCVDAINAYRRAVGSPPLTPWPGGESCASAEAMSDAKSKAAHGAFGQCGEFAQDECPGWGGPPAQMLPKCLQMMWAEGPGGGHYENMKNAHYTQVSCGFYTLPDGSVWAVQNFR